METPQTGLVKCTKVFIRTVIYVLSILLFIGLLLLPEIASSAQLAQQLGIGPYLPIILEDSHFGATDTPTPTSTATPTATMTGTLPTPTRTSTATPTFTKTSTQPTPTATGTLTAVPLLKVSVTPTQAKVNETFTFIIEAGNSGTTATRNNLIMDSFPTYIDVITVTSTRGSVTKLSHSFVVTIGDVFPGEKITVTAVVKVNSTLTRTETQTNIVTMTYDISKSVTASVSYKVLYQTLPPTGELPLNWRETRIKPVAVIPGILIMTVGVMLLLIGIWYKVRDRKNTIAIIAVGAILLITGFIVGATAIGLFKPIQQANEYQSTPTDSGNLAQLQPVEPSATTLPRLPASAFSTPEAIVPVETLPDYPIPSPDITVTPQPGELGPDTSPVVRIIIPGIFLDTEVKYVPYDGFSWMISGLRQEVAWMGNTSWPGLGGNTALAGHVTVAGMGDGPFRHLDELPAGELVILYTDKNIYTYSVRESRVTDDGDMSVTLASDDPQITLITCVDWDEEAHTYLNRLVVFADLMRTEPITIGSVP